MPQGTRQRNRTIDRAFTLIELLVVVAIIALLISILLPSLSKAREQSRGVVCLANERSIGQGLQMYVVEFREALPGPNTSGKDLSNNPSSYVFKHFSAEPTQNMDWTSPTMAKILGLPKDRDRRMTEIFNTQLKCPSNNVKYADEYKGGGGSGLKVSVDIKNLNYVSYSAVLGFAVKGAAADAENPVYARDFINTIRTKPSYAYRIGNVGRAAEKVYVTEGARYVGADGSVTFNAFIKQVAGGNFMDVGPTVKGIGGTAYSRNDATLALHDSAKKLSYRHSGRLNSVFFDGHAQPLGDRESLSVHYWFPRGCTVVKPDWTYDPNDRAGDIIR